MREGEEAVRFFSEGLSIVSSGIWKGEGDMCGGGWICVVTGGGAGSDI